MAERRSFQEFKSTKKVKTKSKIRSVKVYVLERVSALIKEGKHKEAYATFTDTSNRDAELSRIGLFLECHLMNNTNLKGKETDLVDFIMKRMKVFKSVQKDEKFAGYLTGNSTLYDRNIGLLLEKVENLSETFPNFTNGQKKQIAVEIIELTERRIIKFLEKQFDLAVFNFYKLYKIKTQKLRFNPNKGVFSFFKEESYFKSLTFDELMAIYKFNDHFPVFIQACTRNPHLKFLIPIEFRRQMPNKMDEETVKKMKRVCEIKFNSYLYERSEREGFRTPLMTRKSNKIHLGGRFAIPPSKMRSKKKKNEVEKQ